MVLVNFGRCQRGCAPKNTPNSQVPGLVQIIIERVHSYTSPHPRLKLFVGYAGSLQAFSDHNG